MIEDLNSWLQSATGYHPLQVRLDRSFSDVCLLGILQRVKDFLCSRSRTVLFHELYGLP